MTLDAQGSATVAALPEEAPASLFDLEFGSTEVEFLVKGSWEASLIGQAGLVLSPSTGASLQDLVPVVFSQTPDLYLSFLLFKKLFVETRVSSDLTQTKYSMGYKGGSDELLKELRVGNDGISFPVLPFLSLGEGSWRSFGIGLKLASGVFSGRAMLRYDQAIRVERSFVGSQESTEAILSVADFSRGRWFVLPAAGVADLSLYVASKSGEIQGSDGLAYRLVDGADYSFQASTGLVSLEKTALTKVLATYAGATGLSLPALGKDCVVLYDPDATDQASLGSATLVLCRYELSGSEGQDAFVRDKATGLRDSSYAVTIDDSGYAEVTRNGMLDPRDAAYRQPFASDPDIHMTWLYTTDFSATSTTSPTPDYAPQYSREIVLRQYSAAQALTIEKDVIDGSVEVRRNGIPDYAFTVDASTGTLSLATAPGLGEEISISYLRESANTSSGSIAAGLAGVFDLGKDKKAWSALGLRWSLPGASYSQAGILDPGSLVLTVGESDEEGPLRHSAAIGASWSTEEAAGRYRIDGMEDVGFYKTAWRAFTGASDFVIAAVDSTDVKADLSTDFPTLMASLHADGTTQAALRIEAGGTGSPVSLGLERFVEAPPCAALLSLSFFARKTAGSSLATISLGIDGGGGGSADDELSVVIPASALSDAWRRFVFNYGRGDSNLYYQESEGSAMIPVTAVPIPVVDLSLAQSARIFIAVNDATNGDRFYIDEILLEESAGKASLLFKTAISYEDKKAGIGMAAFPVLTGIKVAADASGALAEASWASGGLSAATRLGPVGIILRLRSRWSESGLAFHGGHEISLPDVEFPLRIVDIYDIDNTSGAFGRSDDLTLKAGKLAGLSLGQSSIWTAPTLFGTGLLDQKWTGKLLVGGGVLGLEVKAESVASPLAIPLPEGYFPRWLDAWRFALPAFEDSATKRGFAATATFGLGGGVDIGKVGVTTEAKPATASDPRSNDFVLKLQAPVKVGEDLLFSLYYQREWKEKKAGSGTGLVDLCGLSLDDAGSALPLWTSIPVGELFSLATMDGFRSATSSAESAAYLPEIGLVVARTAGSSWTDFLIPTALSLSYGKELGKKDDSYTDSSFAKLGARFSAANVLGRFGTHPLFRSFESDEYQSSWQGSLGNVEGEASSRFSLIVQHLVTLYGNGNRDSLTFDNRFSIAQEPSESMWSETLKFSLSEVKKRIWLFDLYQALVEASMKTPAAGKASADGGASSRSSLVSAYLGELRHAVAVSRIIYAISAAFSSSQGDSAAASLAMNASQSVEWKLTIPQKLTISAKPFLTETRDASTELLTLGAGFTLAATISF